MKNWAWNSSAVEEAARIVWGDTIDVIDDLQESMDVQHP